MKLRPMRSVLIIPAVCAALITGGCSRTTPVTPVKQQQTEATNDWKAPDPATIPEGPAGESIKLGRQIFLNTPRFAAAYVGNQLSCNDCHIQAGTAAFAAPVVGVPGLFPMYRERAGRVITFEDRIQECFTRSENGRPLPYASPELVGLVAYIQWLSQGVPAGHAFPGRGLVKLPGLHGDAVRGEAIYAKQCAGCHGSDGAGTPPILPPVWGATAYNVGAGISKVEKMAAFVQHNMPQNKPGSLTPQEAFDVSAYVAGKPHPAFNQRYAKY